MSEAADPRKLTEDEFYDYLDANSAIDLAFVSFYKGEAKFVSADGKVHASIKSETADDAWSRSFNATAVLDDGFKYMRDDEAGVYYDATDGWW